MPSWFKSDWTICLPLLGSRIRVSLLPEGQYCGGQCRDFWDFFSGYFRFAILNPPKFNTFHPCFISFHILIHSFHIIFNLIHDQEKQLVCCSTVARAGEVHVTFTAFPLSFHCDAHIPHLSSLVRQSDLCSRPVHT